MGVFAFSYPSQADANIISFLTGLFKSTSATTTETIPTSPASMPLLQAPLSSDPLASSVSSDLTIVGGEALMAEEGAGGTMADISLEKPKSDKISVYVVREGDSLSAIADMYDVTINTIKWANDITGPIHEGDVLTILPISGLTYTVKKGDTLASIAKKYKADVDEITEYNEIDGALVVGQKIVIPNAEMDLVHPTTSSGASKVITSGGPSYSGYYIRPLSGGKKSQGIHGYNAVDIATPTGTPIYASADGEITVSKAGGWNGGYGSYVVISHPNGTQTVYGHLSQVFVSRGQKVSQGDVIGNSGNTGRSTGPHLHFEIRGAKNPF